MGQIITTTVAKHCTA